MVDVLNVVEVHQHVAYLLWKWSPLIRCNVFLQLKGSHTTIAQAQENKLLVRVGTMVEIHQGASASGEKQIIR